MVTLDKIKTFLNQLDRRFARPGQLYLIGETSQVFEGWQSRAGILQFTAKIEEKERPHFDQTVRTIQSQIGLAVEEEFPGDLIPLPNGYQSRARNIDNSRLKLRHLHLFHFDPYSVAFRYIARGDEPDYHLALYYLRNGWIEIEEMERLLAELLPRFSMETIQQDPAEFRRKYKGLLQMWKSVQPGAIHRHTPA